MSPAAAPATEAQVLTPEQLDAELERRREAFEEAEAEVRRLDEVLADPEERVKRRLVLREALADWAEHLPLSREQFDAIAQHLAPKHRWIVGPKTLDAGGWQQVGDGEEWKMDPARAPALPPPEAAESD